MRLRGVFTCCVNSFHSPPSEPSAYKGAYTGYVSAQPRLRTEKYAPIGIHRPVARLCNPSPSSEPRTYSAPLFHTDLCSLGSAELCGEGGGFAGAATNHTHTNLPPFAKQGGKGGPSSRRPTTHTNLPPIAKQSLWGRGTVVAATVDEGILSTTLKNSLALARISIVP